jgi:hypothetical protein
VQLERIERRWSGRCVVAASGPSLTPVVAEMCRGERVIAVNDAYRPLPFAAVLYACDGAWFEQRQGCQDFAGERWTSHGLSPKNDKTRIADRFGLRVVEGADRPGFSLDPGVIHYGNNSGYQAANLAILFGADPIVLVGFDMRAVDGKRHFFGNHKAPLSDSGKYSVWIANFAQAGKMLGARPRIINATPGSALTSFPMMPLSEALDGRMAA